MSKQLVSSTDAVPYQEFARLIGKTPAAVKGMIEKGKLPVIEMTDPSLLLAVRASTGFTFQPGTTA